MSFVTFQNEKMPFQAIKTTSLKSRKIDNFSKGLTHGFSPKVAFFLELFFQPIQARKMPLKIIQNEKTLFKAIKTRSSKSRKTDIFPKRLTHGLGLKMPIFPNFVQVIQAGKMSFMIFQKEKTPFQAVKTRSSKNRKSDIFPKGLSHGFGSKMAIFFNFLFFQQIQVKKMSFMIF